MKDAILDSWVSDDHRKCTRKSVGESEAVPLAKEYAQKHIFQIRGNRGKWKMAANLSKVAGMGSCINGHVVQNDSAMSEPLPGQEKVAILDAGAQYGKVR